MAKIVCIYYSWAGNSKEAAEAVRETTGCPVFHLEPVRQYSSDYRMCCDEARDEKTRQLRPECKKYPDCIGDYDTIVLCYPCWWGTLPMFFWTMLEKYDLKGKKILPLCCNGGSRMGKSEDDLKKLCPGAIIAPGLPIPDGTVSGRKDEISAWLKRNGAC